MKRIRTTNPNRGLGPKSKLVKKENFHDDGYKINEGYQTPTLKPSVEIISCISYQKFRYSGENRPGKKYQEKEFMTLKLCHLSDKVVRVVIICTDADNRELIHPNGLVGKDCHDGIYDKEYAVTKPTFSIKIPYLRTERIKTKKNEHSKIQKVLSERASHLPSPYKERCLSQCTDKYTSSRKFDTTKVCLGVIVTVQSHQGPFNGSLHAISHVVRNASEKTSLKILKLSQEVVCTSSGGLIDIFTTEDGPLIEPEKYTIYVTSDHDGEEECHWESQRHSPCKEQILYKRIITYQVPPYEANPNSLNHITATLHLECPQSAQYCSYPFQYGPSGSIVIEDPTYNGHKYYEQQDIKPSKHRLRQELYEADANSETIKANLKSKLTSRQGEQIFIDSANESHGENNHYILQDSHQNFNGQHSVLIRHQDPQTGESSYLLDMDASKTLTNGIGSNQQFVQQYSLERLNESDGVVQSLKPVMSKRSSYTSSPDVEVVATGFSEAVPPNTTVLIYTTNGGFTEHVAIEGASGEQVVIQELSEEEATAGSSIIINDGVNAPSSMAQNVQSEQVIRRDTLAEKNLSNSMQNAQSLKSTAREKSQRGVTHSSSDQAIQGSERQNVVRGSYSSSNVQVNPSGKPAPDRLSPGPTSSPSTIPPLRRMLISIPSKSSASAWEVGTDEDQSESYNLINYGYADNKQNAVKQELSEHGLTQSQSLASASPYQNHYASQKQLHIVENSESNSPRSNSSREGDVGSKHDGGQKLASMDFNMQQAIVENLPTMKVIELAEIIESGLPSTTTTIEPSDA